MKTRHAVLNAVVGAIALAPMHIAGAVECVPFVIPASATYDEVTTLVRRCTEYLRSRSTSEDTRSPAAGGDDGSPATSPPRCDLDLDGWRQRTSQECLRCHRAAGLNHPFAVDYASAYANRPRAYRAPDVVRARGVLLPDGEIRCVTCHAAGSALGARVFLPPGAATRADPVTGKPTVDGTPLCNVCHSKADTNTVPGLAFAREGGR